MPRSAQSTGKSTATLRPCVAAAAPAPFGPALRRRGPRGLECGAGQAEHRRRRAEEDGDRAMLQRAIRAIRAEDPKTAYEWAVKASNRMSTAASAGTLLGISLERAGDLANSSAPMRPRSACCPSTATSLATWGAWRCDWGWKPQAEELFRRYLQRYPNDPEAANNLVCAIRGPGSARKKRSKSSARPS